jgi:hypothetical protein
MSSDGSKTTRRSQARTPLRVARPAFVPSYKLADVDLLEAEVVRADDLAPARGDTQKPVPRWAALLLCDRGATAAAEHARVARAGGQH